MNTIPLCPRCGTKGPSWNGSDCTTCGYKSYTQKAKFSDQYMGSHQPLYKDAFAGGVEDWKALAAAIVLSHTEDTEGETILIDLNDLHKGYNYDVSFELKQDHTLAIRVRRRR